MLPSNIGYVFENKPGLQTKIMAPGPPGSGTGYSLYRIGGVTHQSDTFGHKLTHIRLKHLVSDLHTLE